MSVNRHRKLSYGYSRGDRFAREDSCKADGKARTPSCFRELSLIDALAIRVHEMVHLWQHHHGQPGRGRYHNGQRAEKMKDVGL